MRQVNGGALRRTSKTAPRSNSAMVSVLTAYRAFTRSTCYRTVLENGRPTDLVRVLDQLPQGMAAMPGYVWLDMPGKVRSVREQELEFTEEEPTA